MVSAAGSVCLALVFARLAAFRPASGGPYAYTRQAYGDLAGFLVAWGYWISIWTANAALAVAFVGYLDPFIPSVVRNPISAASLAVGMVWLLTAVNCRGTLGAGRVQLVTTALKVLPLLLIGIAGTIAFEPSHFSLAGVEGGHREGRHGDGHTHAVGVRGPRERDGPGGEHHRRPSHDPARDGYRDAAGGWASICSALSV